MGRYEIQVFDSYGVRPEQVVCDLHPDYASTAMSHELSEEVTPIQHHLAQQRELRTHTDQHHHHQQPQHRERTD